MIDDARQVDCVPQDDGTDYEVESRGAERLALEGTSRISPRSWKNTARVSLLPASPLLRPARQRLRSAGSEYHSIMNSVRSMRPISRRARDNMFVLGRAASFLSTVEGATVRSSIDRPMRRTSSQASRMAAVSMRSPMWFQQHIGVDILEDM